MIVQKKEREDGKIVIDLTGPRGNAFFLMAVAEDCAKEADWSEEETQAMIADMKSDDYEHLVQVLDKNFGYILILERL
jgi:hypothetical protein